MHKRTPGTEARGQGCIRREGTSEAAPEAVRQADGAGCQSDWGRYCRLQMPLKLALGARKTVAGHRLGGVPMHLLYTQTRTRLFTASFVDGEALASDLKFRGAPGARHVHGTRTASSALPSIRPPPPPTPATPPNVCALVRGDVLERQTARGGGAAHPLGGSIRRGARAVHARCGYWGCSVDPFIQSQSGGMVMPQEPTRYYLQLLSQ